MNKSMFLILVGMIVCTGGLSADLQGSDDTDFTTDTALLEVDNSAHGEVDSEQDNLDQLCENISMLIEAKEYDKAIDVCDSIIEDSHLPYTRIFK